MVFKYILFYFHPDPWGNDSIWRAYFSDGWFNHQLVSYCWWFRNPTPVGMLSVPLFTRAFIRIQVAIAGFLNHQRYHFRCSRLFPNDQYAISVSRDRCLLTWVPWHFLKKKHTSPRPMGKKNTHQNHTKKRFPQKTSKQCRDFCFKIIGRRVENEGGEMNNHRFTMHDGKRPEDLSIQVVGKGYVDWNLVEHKWEVKKNHRNSY